jgi:hypothetical protein
VSHNAYPPVGYSYQADNYCLDCIPGVAAKPNEYGFPLKGKADKPAVVKHNGGNGYSRGACNCCECRLDRMAQARGVDRYSEGSFDSGDFPKAITRRNDLHCECGPERYGYSADDPEVAGKQYCNARCAKCHAVIDGTCQLDGPDICPAYEQRMANR